MPRISLVTAILAAPAVLAAQTTTGTLNGTVADTQGRPLVGATVVLKSTALFSERRMTTNARGEWNAQMLPVGTYRVQCSKEGYIGKDVTNLRIGIGVSLRQDLVMTPVQVAQATVEVVAATAGVDKSDAKTSVNYSSEKMDVLPTIAGRGEGSAFLMTVGVSTETVSGQPAVRGGSILDTQISVNGASIKDEVTGGVTHTWYVEDNLEDIQVMLSPLHARYGRVVGGQVNMVTKTGSNDFHGSIRSNISSGAWNASSTQSSHGAGSVYDTLNRNYQVTLNGPIIPDRVWFSVASIITPSATNPNQFWWYNGERPFVQSIQTGNPLIDAVTATDVTTFQPLPGSRIPSGYHFSLYDAFAPAFPQTSSSNYWEAKVNAALAPDHTVELSYMKASDTHTNTDFYNDLWQTDRIAALGSSKDDRSSVAFGYNGLLGGQNFVEFHLARNQDKMIYPLGDVNYGGGKFDLYEYDALATGEWINGGAPWGATYANGPQRKTTLTSSLNFKHIADWHGSHEIDVGLDFFQTSYDTDVSMGSDNRFYFYGGHYVNDQQQYLFPTIIFQGMGVNGSGWDAGYMQPYGLAPTMTQYLGKDGTIKSWDKAFYVNDTWTVNNHWNVMAGLRLDTEAIIDTDGRSLVKSTDPSPRLQVKYDIKGNSRELVTFTAARYTSNFSQGFAQSLSQNGTNKSISRAWSGIPGQKMPGDPDDNGYYGVRFVDFATLTNPDNYHTVYAYNDNTKSINVAPNLGPQKVDEFTVGFQHFHDNGSNIRLTYVNRAWRDIWGVAQDYSPDQMVLLSDPSGSGLSPMYAQVTRVFNSSDLKRNYQSLELDVNIQTGGVWTFGGNWTFSRLTGNNEGGEDLGGGSERLNSVTPYYNQRNFLLNVMHVSPDNIAPDGRLLDDMTHRIRLFATAVVPMGQKGQLSFSWMVRYTTGIAYGANKGNSIGMPASFVNSDGSLGIPQIPNDAAGNAYPAPGSDTWLRVNGALRPFEQNDMWEADFKLGWTLPLGFGKAAVIGDVTVRNLLNTDPAKPYATQFMSPGWGDAAQTYVDPTLFGRSQDHGVASGANYWVSPRAISASLGLRF